MDDAVEEVDSCLQERPLAAGLVGYESDGWCEHLAAGWRALENGRPL